MNIPFDYYKIFYYVAKNKSFTKAAEELYISQPNITRTIKKLEEMLDISLFSRNNHAVNLTPEGEEFYKRISIAINQIEKAEKELLLKSDLDIGYISLGASEVALHSILIHCLCKFNSLYPNIKIKLLNYTTFKALEALKNGLCDVIIVSSPIINDDNLEVIKVGEFQDYLVCSNSYYEKNKININELNSLNLISLDSQTATYKFFSDLFLKHHTLYQPNIEIETVDQILPLLNNNLGIAFLPEMFINESLKKVNLDIKIPSREIYLIKLANSNLNAATKEFIKILTR